jgi:hypothetical protein
VKNPNGSPTEQSGENQTMARPTKNSEAMGAKVVFRLPLNIDEQLRADAIAKGVSISELLRNAVESFYAPKVQVVQVKQVTKAKAKAKAKTKA